MVSCCCVSFAVLWHLRHGFETMWVGAGTMECCYLTAAILLVITLLLIVSYRFQLVSFF